MSSTFCDIFSTRSLVDLIRSSVDWCKATSCSRKYPSMHSSSKSYNRSMSSFSKNNFKPLSRGKSNPITATTTDSQQQQEQKEQHKGGKTLVWPGSSIKLYVPTFSTFRFPNEIFQHWIAMAEGNQRRWQHWFLLVLHDNGKPLKHPNLVLFLFFVCYGKWKCSKSRV